MLHVFFYRIKKYIQNKLKGGQYSRESPPMLVNTYVEKQQKRHFLVKNKGSGNPDGNPVGLRLFKISPFDSSSSKTYI